MAVWNLASPSGGGEVVEAVEYDRGRLPGDSRPEDPLDCDPDPFAVESGVSFLWKSDKVLFSISLAKLAAWSRLPSVIWSTCPYSGGT